MPKQQTTVTYTRQEVMELIRENVKDKLKIPGAANSIGFHGVADEIKPGDPFATVTLNDKKN